MIKICENCSQEWDAKRTHKRFCSEICSKAFFAVSPKNCELESCQREFKPLKVDQRFCSRSCSATFNNSISPKRVASGTRKCKQCGERIPVSLALCDNCRVRPVPARPEIYIDRWLRGEESGSDANGQLKKFCRSYLVTLAENKCTRCGWGEPNPLLGRPILTVDHIDGSWRNNSVDNLVVLCYNCHTLTPTFNALNIGNGQGIRGSGNRAYKQAAVE